MLDVALQFEHTELLDILLDFATPTQRLLLACRRGDATTARATVHDHPDLLAGLTEEDHRAIADAAWQGDAKAVALMLELGFDPRVAGHDAGTALHCAAWYGSPECVAVLLDHPDAPSLLAIRDGVHHGTPFGWCCHGSLHGPRGHDHVGVARLLLEAGTPIDEGIEASDAVLDVLARRMVP